jgi:hypothetical protein
VPCNWASAIRNDSEHVSSVGIGLWNAAEGSLGGTSSSTCCNAYEHVPLAFTDRHTSNVLGRESRVEIAAQSARITSSVRAQGRFLPLHAAGSSPANIVACFESCCVVLWCQNSGRGLGTSLSLVVGGQGEKPHTT